MTNGRAVVYELIGSDGKIAFDKTFDLAVYLKNNINYDKLILNYDSYNPDGTLHVDIILIMPEIISPWRVTYNKIIETSHVQKLHFICLYQIKIMLNQITMQIYTLYILPQLVNLLVHHLQVQEIISVFMYK